MQTTNQNKDSRGTNPSRSSRRRRKSNKSSNKTGFYKSSRGSRGSRQAKNNPKYNRKVMPEETIADIQKDIERIEKEILLEIQEISNQSL